MNPASPDDAAHDRRLAYLALPLCAVVFWAALELPSWLRYPRDLFAPGSVPTHAVMVVASVALAALLDRRWRARLGLTRGTYRFRPGILLWVLPTAVPAILSALGGGPGAGPRGPFTLSPARTVIFVWIVASVAEEILYRACCRASSRPGRPAERGSSGGGSSDFPSGSARWPSAWGTSSCGR